MMPQGFRRNSAKGRITVPLACFLGGLILGVLAGVYGVGYWEGHGNADRLARLNTMLNVQSKVIRYARKHGVYPMTLVDALDKDHLQALSRWGVPPESLEYVAAGKPYVEQNNVRLFYEKTPTDYGWISGWWDIYELDYYFVVGERIAAKPGDKAAEVGHPL